MKYVASRNDFSQYIKLETIMIYTDTDYYHNTNLFICVTYKQETMKETGNAQAWTALLETLMKKLS